MIQTIFETRQRANELLQKAIEIWRGGDQSDKLEGIENDPVFSLLMTALAYQANETETEIEQMKMELLEEYANIQTPFEMGHAIPATAVVETALQDNIPEMDLTSDHVFTLGYNGTGFIPLLQTRVLNASIKSVVRLDGRRWKVNIAFKSPISDLSGFAFSIRNHNYRDLRITIQGQPLPLINPWDYSELPLSPCFALDTILYNKSQTYMASSLCIDLFARQNVRMYCVRRHHSPKMIPFETENVELVFEFFGVGDKFVFDESNLALNSVILVNAQQQSVTLSTENPIVRVTGYQSQNQGQTDINQQFLHLLRPSEEQLYGNMQVEVRRLAADRFNQGMLVKALNNMISKYYSDYNAFLHISGVASDKVLNDLAQILNRMADAIKTQNANSLPGVYLMLRTTEGQRRQQASLELSYITTSGASVNNFLNAEARFIPPSGFEAKGTRQIGLPVPGFDEIRDESATASLSHYYMATNDRLVTPADIKLFCYHELLTRYGIVRDMVKSLVVSHRQQFDLKQCGYEILVEITLIENSFVKRGFADKKDSIEILMESMIRVRSTNIYPVKVSIKIDPDNN